MRLLLAAAWQSIKIASSRSTSSSPFPLNLNLPFLTLFLTTQSDLHAIFLHYCLLDTGFARYWPPRLTLPGWLAFMRDIGSTNLVPGTRTRSDTMINVSDAVIY